MEFVNCLIVPHLVGNGKSAYCGIQAIDLGGTGSWAKLKEQITIQLRKDRNNVVTTFIDYYQRPNKLPGGEQSARGNDPYGHVAKLEEAMDRDIPEIFRGRFIPYLQLHELEGLLFHSIAVFDRIFEQRDMQRDRLKQILQEFPNPELINEGANTAPSKRLIRCVAGYSKILHCAMLAEAIGLQGIRARARHFNEWIARLENPDKTLSSWQN